MADLSLFTGTFGALVGVVLGAVLSGRSRRALLREYHRQTGVAARKLRTPNS